MYKLLLYWRYLRVRFIALAYVYSVVSLVSGCVRTSHQLSEVGEAVTDGEIVGIWEEHDPVFGVRESDRICIEANDDGAYLLRNVTPGDDDAVPFRLVKSAGMVYIEVDAREMGGSYAEIARRSGRNTAATSSDGACYLFPIRLESKGEWMAFTDADSTVLKRLMHEGTLNGRMDQTWNVCLEITSTAAELETCLREHGKEIYAIDGKDAKGARRAVYRRVSTQVPVVISTPSTNP